MPVTQPEFARSYADSFLMRELLQDRAQLAFHGADDGNGWIVH
jgi:hypothetical protein